MRDRATSAARKILGVNPDWRKRGKSGGRYYVVYCPDHPRSWSNGYVYEHVLLTEIRSRRFLHRHEVVHHRDGNGLNNAPHNLLIKNRSEHAREHGREALRKMVVFFCPACLQITKKRAHGTAVARKGVSTIFCSPRCRSWYTRRVQLRLLPKVPAVNILYVCLETG